MIQRILPVNIAVFLLAMFYHMAHIGLPFGDGNLQVFDDLES
jgi:hypothetical protein